MSKNIFSMYVYAVYMFHKYMYTYIYTAIFVDIELHNETLFEKKIGIKIQQNHISVIRFRSKCICIIGVSYIAIEPISSFNITTLIYDGTKMSNFLCSF